MGKVSKIESPKLGNVVEAAASGAGDGLHLALNVGAMLIAFLGLLALVNAGLGLVHPELSLQLVLGYAFWPIACVMGVPFADIPELAQLIGTKLIATEFVAYQDLGKMAAAGTVTPRTVMIASFALCGFANFSSVAIQIGGLGAMAPERRGDLARLGVRAMFGGAIATCMTACVAGVLASEGGQ
jgi:CNT family concentrative nucleoside transporter